MEDVRLQRETGAGAFTRTAVNGVSTPIVPLDERRTALIIGVIGTVDAIICPQPQVPSATSGIRLDETNGPLVLDLIHHGRLVTCQWNAIGDGADSVVNVFFSDLEKT